MQTQIFISNEGYIQLTIKEVFSKHEEKMIIFNQMRRHTRARLLRLCLVYYVEEKSQVIYTTRARGNLKYANNTIGGRFCRISSRYQRRLRDEILPRYSQMIRPAVANVDVALLVASVTEPNTAKIIRPFLVYLGRRTLNRFFTFPNGQLTKLVSR